MQRGTRLGVQVLHRAIAIASGRQLDIAGKKDCSGGGLYMPWLDKRAHQGAGAADGFQRDLARCWIVHPIDAGRMAIHRPAEHEIGLDQI
ncbi:hypothetical protein WJ972_09585 [Achromobacter insuavis]